MALWTVLMPHSKKVVVQIPGSQGPFFVECEHLVQSITFTQRHCFHVSDEHSFIVIFTSIRYVVAIWLEAPSGAGILTSLYSIQGQ